MPRHAATIESLPQAFDVVKEMPAGGLGTGARAVARSVARRWPGSSKAGWPRRWSAGWTPLTPAPSSSPCRAAGKSVMRQGQHGGRPTAIAITISGRRFGGTKSRRAIWRSFTAPDARAATADGSPRDNSEWSRQVGKSQHRSNAINRDGQINEYQAIDTGSHQQNPQSRS